VTAHLRFVVLTASLAAAGCSAAAPPPVPAASSRPPNIVFIVVDDMRWDEMRVAGHPVLETPNMDRLAREGMRFLNAFATTPLCSPSRASLLTGQYAYSRHHRQHRAAEPRAAHVPARAAARGVHHRIFRQVAHGQ
jgi:N-acetylglucosamine-6-sulfatase